MCSEEIVQYIRGENDCKIAGDTEKQLLAACRTLLAVRLAVEASLHSCNIRLKPPQMNDCLGEMFVTVPLIGKRANPIG